MTASRLLLLLFTLSFLQLISSEAISQDKLPVTAKVERQPLVSATKRLQQTLKFVGAPLSDNESRQLEAAYKEPDDRKAIVAIQQILDPHCLAGVTINPESRVSVVEGQAKKELVEQGWRSFLIKVYNEAGITPVLKVDSPQALPVYMRGRGARQRPSTDDKLVDPSEVADRFLDLELYARQPVKPQLSGLEIEYRIIHLFSRDAGKREATLQFNVGQGTQDLGFRSELPVLFTAKSAVDVVFRYQEAVPESKQPITAAIVVRDAWGRVYPNPARRLAPDFFFHDQVYRKDGESISLPPGEYRVTVTRGPEYYPSKRTIRVEPGKQQIEAFTLERWIHPRKRHWYSGDHHVHAAGCKHYDSPTEGVSPQDMMRHILGEDLNVGCVLTWGPCWYSQKKFFEGSTSELSIPNYVMRYDIEVSGFPSSHAGHLCLLRLTEDDYPGTEVLEDWPSWTLPVLKWGQEQGGVVGYSHSGWGLGLPDYAENGQRLSTIPYPNRGQRIRGKAAHTLPDYAMPPFDGIGANEFIVTVAHDACDFISAVDTPAIWELNIWYHTLNCGFRSRISGETDFPCIYGDKVGLGRIYVKLPEDQPLTFDSWIQGVKDGRSYCSDGLSHIMDFTVNDVAVGEPGSGGKVSQLNLDQPQKVKVTFDVAALLEQTPTEVTNRIRNARLDAKPYWHIERCRIGDTRTVPVEVVVNGEVVARKEIEADGSTQSVEFDVMIDQSSWVAARILPSVHTNPVFVHVGNQPIRASRKSAEWCRKAVDVCWNSKKGRIRESEQVAAKKAYDQAREIYDRIIAESK